jgi:hypothetical protein
LQSSGDAPSHFGLRPETDLSEAVNGANIEVLDLLDLFDPAKNLVLSRSRCLTTEFLGGIRFSSFISGSIAPQSIVERRRQVLSVHSSNQQFNSHQPLDLIKGC